MNGIPVRRSLGATIFALAGWIWLSCLSAAEPPRQAVPSETKSQTATKKTDPATRTVTGRVFDSHGKPLADANVWLIRQDGSHSRVPDSTVIADSLSRADGRFDLAPLVADLEKHADDPLAQFEMWVWKRGQAVGHWGSYGEPAQEPINVFLPDDAAFVVVLKTPQGAPCQGATVTPVFAEFDYTRAIPRPLQERLKFKTAADGHADIHGLNGHLKGLLIEKAGLGNQTLLLSDRASSPLVAAVHDTRTLEGHFVFPKGDLVDPSQATVLIDVYSSKMSPCKQRAKDDSDSSLFGFWQQFAPKIDRTGRFCVSGVLDHGSSQFHVEAFPDTPFLFAAPAPEKPRKPDPAEGIIKQEIPIIRGIWCDVLVRDAQTKKPLAGVDLAIAPKRVADGQAECDEDISLPDFDRTDSKGRIRFRVLPGETYRAYCAWCEGYLDWSANSSEVHIPAGAARFEMPPIELVRTCAIKGRLADDNGKPLKGANILAAWSVDGRRNENPKTDVAHWTATDSAGLLHVEDIAAGTRVTLFPTRAGVPIGDPVRIVAGEDKPVALRTRKEELVALSGRVLGLDHKPLAAAQIRVEIDNSSGALTCFPVQTGADGTFRTPAHFPNRLKYRLTARLLLDNVGTSDWLCPAVAGTTFPDFSVDAAKLRIGIRLCGDEIVARVNGEPIRAREILERANDEHLTGGRSLLAANQELAAGKITQREFRALQDEAINKHAAEFARIRLRAQSCLAQLDSNQRNALEEAVAKEFAGQVGKLKARFRVGTDDEVDSRLKRQGRSLAGVRAVWRYKLIADEYSRANPTTPDALWKKAIATYKAHLDRYATPERVGWQLIEVNFYKPRPVSIETTSANQTDSNPESSGVERDIERTSVGSQSPPAGVNSRTSSWMGEAFEAATKVELPPDPAQDKPSPFSNDWKSTDHSAKSPHEGERYVGKRQPRQILESALEELHKGEAFESVAKRLSEGLGGQQGGWQMPVRPDSIADMKTAAALRELPEGAISSIIETAESVRIVRVVSRIPASHKPFEDVNESIQGRLQQELEKKRWNALLARSSVELPFDPPIDLPDWQEGGESTEQ